MPTNFEKPTARTLVHLAEMMATMRALEWVPGDSGRAFAKKHKLSYDHVKHLSAEAWKRICAEVHDKDYVGATVGLAIEKVLRDALAENDDPAHVEAGHDRNGDPIVHQESPSISRKVVIEAAKVWAAIAGAAAAQRVELTGKDGGALALTMNARDVLLAKLDAIAEVEGGEACGPPTKAATGGHRKAKRS